MVAATKTKRQSRSQAKTTTEETWVSTTVFRKKFGFSEAYVRKMIDADELKAGVVPRPNAKRKTYRIPMSEVTRFDEALNKGVPAK